MRKIIELEDYFPTGEVTAQIILPWNNGRGVDTSRISKRRPAVVVAKAGAVGGAEGAKPGGASRPKRAPAKAAAGGAAPAQPAAS